eukprot:6182084-Pleurochrysis_carterae.AAC.3
MFYAKVHSSAIAARARVPRVRSLHATRAPLTQTTTRVPFALDFQSRVHAISTAALCSSLLCVDSRALKNLPSDLHADLVADFQQQLKRPAE